VPLFLDLLACLLPFGLAILVLCRATTFIQEHHQRIRGIRDEIRDTVREHWRPILLVMAFIVFIVFDLPYLLNKATDITGPYWKYWLQTVAGNWSPEAFPPFSPKPKSPDTKSEPDPSQATTAQTPPAQTAPALSDADRYEFSLSAALAFWLNNAIIIVLIGLVWRISIERRRLMDIATALKDRDSMVIATIQGIFRKATLPLNSAERLDIIHEVEDAFNKGANDWAEKYLRSKTNEKEAKSIVDILKPTR
jgi:hypothetical protein